jgi:phosphoserine phosphatase
MRRAIHVLSAVVCASVVACGGAVDGARGAPGDTGPSGGAGAGGPVGPAGAPGAEPTTLPPGPRRLLDERLGGWSAANRARLNKLFGDRGSSSASYDAAHRPIAVFDWDNTILKNDIGDATFFWMVKHDKIRQPAGKDWTTTNVNLTPAATAALDAACGALAAPGAPLPTSTNPACADAIVSIYDSTTTPAGAAAWSVEKSVTINNPYAWVAQLTTGWAPEDVRDFARAAYEENAYAPIGTTQTVGTGTDFNGYVRVYEQMADLIGALSEDGFDVWITTASPQLFVEAISQQSVGVPPSHVLGIRSMIVNGLVTSNLEGCGLVADATNTMITFDEGKRCWINKVIYKEQPANQAPSNSDPSKRAVFVAGDSDTDIAFLKDGAELKLVIDRNKPQVMCNALHNYQNKWIWEPMFIAPKSKKTTPYACNTLPDNGGTIGIKDESGALIPPQSEP